EGCAFDQLSVTVGTGEYNESVYEFIKKHEHKELDLEMHGFLIEKEAQLGLAPMRKLCINYKQWSVNEQYLSVPTWNPDDDILLDLVKRRDTLLKVEFDVQLAETIFEIFTLVVDYDRSQCVIF
ncbi:hypothetical protein PFISCL1PPCAC_29071, partial [Pristionchus fissidentatus]